MDEIRKKFTARPTCYEIRGKFIWLTNSVLKFTWKTNVYILDWRNIHIQDIQLIDEIKRKIHRKSYLLWDSRKIHYMAYQFCAKVHLKKLCYKLSHIAFQFIQSFTWKFGMEILVTQVTFDLPLPDFSREIEGDVAHRVRNTMNFTAVGKMT